MFLVPLGEVGATFVPIDVSCGRAALKAFEHFGKGRHPAALNLGDCFAYACAQLHHVPLLCRGDDFPQTDATLG